MSAPEEPWLDRARRFVGADVWNLELRPGSLGSSALRLVQLLVMIGEGFVRDQLLLRAAALTYMTLLSIVPLFAVSFAIVTGLGVSEKVVEMAVETLAAGSPGATEYILDLVHHANIGSLGTLSAGVLVITTVLALRQIEATFNKIWGLHRSRGWMRRFTDYLAVLVVAPLLAGMALSLGTSLGSEPLFKKLMEVWLFRELHDLGLVQMPRILLVLAFTFLYWFFPNTQVRLLPALAGGVVSALLFTSAQHVYVVFNVGAARASVLFGGLSALPLFLAWNYVSWCIVLLGAELSFALQNLSHYRRELRGAALCAAEREAAGLKIAVEIARTFRDGAEAKSASELAESLDLAIRVVREQLERLIDARIVTACEADERPHGYQLGRPAERILISDVLLALRGELDEAAEASTGETDAAVCGLIAELDDAAGKIARHRSLADVLN